MCVWEARESQLSLQDKQAYACYGAALGGQLIIVKHVLDGKPHVEADKYYAVTV